MAIDHYYIPNSKTLVVLYGKFSSPPHSVDVEKSQNCYDVGLSTICIYMMNFDENEKHSASIDTTLAGYIKSKIGTPVVLGQTVRVELYLSPMMRFNSNTKSVQSTSFGATENNGFSIDRFCSYMLHGNTRYELTEDRVYNF